MSITPAQRVLVDLILAQRRPDLRQWFRGEDLLALSLSARNEIRDEIESVPALFGFEEYEPNELGIERERGQRLQRAHPSD